MEWSMIKGYAYEPFSHPIMGAFGAVFLSIFTFLYGNGLVATTGMSLYTGVIALDWISGYRAAKKDGSYASEYGIDGGFRTIFLFIVPALAHGVDLLMSTPNVVFGFALLSFGFHVWKSMTANVYRAGWDKWIPVYVLDIVADEIEHKVARSRKRVAEKQKYLSGDE